MRLQNKQSRWSLFCVGLAFTLSACFGSDSDTPPAGSPPVINSFGASDRLLSPGDTSTLTWDVGNATSVQLSESTGQNVGDVTGKSSMELPHTQTTAHTLTATNAYGSVTATVMVNVITVSDALPSDISVGAQSATLEDAAAFAWQEFIALNWPALAGSRDTPDAKGTFGAAGPVVWETFRHKLETFPGTGEAPHGGSNYNDPPQYIYNPGNVGKGYASLAPGAVPACNSPADASTPFINLDEQSEIGLDQMFAGHGPGSQFAGQQILFLAKSNRVEYDYVFANGWYAPGAAPFAATASAVRTTKSSAPPGSSDLVSFRNGTIEMKAAWRKLTTDGDGQRQVLYGPGSLLPVPGSEADLWRRDRQRQLSLLRRRRHRVGPGGPAHHPEDADRALLHLRHLRAGGQHPLRQRQIPSKT